MKAEILRELQQGGLTKREIAERYGVPIEAVRKLAAGIPKEWNWNKRSR